MADKHEMVILYVVVGTVVGAMAVYIFMTQMNQMKVVDFTRDDSGRIISIVEKRQ